MRNTELLRQLKSRQQSLERQLENCKWADTKLYNELLEVEQQIESLEKE